MLSRPQALLLDFGGVIADAPRADPAPEDLVNRLHELVSGAVPADRISRCLTDGAKAYASWRDRVSDQHQPAELSHVEVWDDFITGDWPPPARAAVRDQATPLSYAWTWRPEWALRPGIPEALDSAGQLGLPVAVVSNTLCGAAHRDFLDRVGLADRFAAQVYSDEIGVRKPNPEMAWRAARELGVSVERCWFVGDSVVRDIACARRAGVGAAVLMRSPRTGREARPDDGGADATIDDGHGLMALLRP